KTKHVKKVLLLVILLFPSLLIAQQYVPFVPSVTGNNSDVPQEKNASWRMIAYGGLGFGTVNNSKAPEYDVNLITGQLLINYKFNPYFGLSSGLSLLQVSGNGFSKKGAFYHSRKTIAIPV